MIITPVFNLLHSTYLQCSEPPGDTTGIEIIDVAAFIDNFPIALVHAYSSSDAAASQQLYMI